MVTDDAPRKKKKKRRKKKAGSKSSAAGSSSTTKKKVTRKKKKSSSRREAPARSQRVAATKAEESGGSSTMLIGVVLAVAVVGGILVVTNKSDETAAAPAASALPSGTIATKTPPVRSAKPKGPPAPADVAAPPKDAKKTASGLAYKVLKKGTGEDKPGVNDTVEVHYSGWTKDGKPFDSSVTRGRPATFGVTKVIKGWTEGLQLMTKGEKTRFWIPADLAYGATPKRPGAPAGQLTFDVELLKIIKAPEVPEDLKEPPKDAKKTKSGLVYKVLKAGEGDGESPTEKDRVEVHYSGWTQSDGKMFDSSVTRGRPAKFGVTGVIKGWTEGLQLMKPGDKFRFWIPADLAYGETSKRPGGPSGTLVFDVELLSVVGGAKPKGSAAPSASAAPKGKDAAPKTAPAPAPAAPKPAAPKPAAPKPKPAAPKPAPASDDPY